MKKENNSRIKFFFFWVFPFSRVLKSKKEFSKKPSCLEFYLKFQNGFSFSKEIRMKRYLLLTTCLFFLFGGLGCMRETSFSNKSKEELILVFGEFNDERYLFVLESFPNFYFEQATLETETWKLASALILLEVPDEKYQALLLELEQPIFVDIPLAESSWEQDMGKKNTVQFVSESYKENSNAYKEQLEVFLKKVKDDTIQYRPQKKQQKKGVFASLSRNVSYLILFFFIVLMVLFFTIRRRYRKKLFKD